MEPEPKILFKGNEKYWEGLSGEGEWDTGSGWGRSQGCGLRFLPRCKRHLISCLQSPSAVMVKSTTVSTVSPSIGHEVMGLDAMILVF